MLKLFHKEGKMPPTSPNWDPTSLFHAATRMKCSQTTPRECK